MRTIFDGLVEEFRAWHLFEQQSGNSRQRELPGLTSLRRPGYGAGSYGGSRGPDYGPADPGVPESGVPGSGVPDSGVPDYGPHDFGVPEFGRIEYGGAGYFDRAPRYDRDLDGAPPPDGTR